MKSFFSFVLRALVLLVVALVSALMAMRIAIHGREVSVPDLSGKTTAEARRVTEKDDLPIELDRRYYSATVPEGRILSQAPTAGTKVRRGWEVRVSESLGPQRVQIPDVAAESERAAELNIRRRGLDVSSVARVSVPGMPDDRVLAQNPPASANDISAPTISFLVNETGPPQAFVMPNFVGESLGTATSALHSADFQIGRVSQTVPARDKDAPAGGMAVSSPGATQTLTAPTSASIIVSQNPTAGQKVVAGTSVSFIVH